MANVRKRLIELLEEFDTLCKEANADYSLVDRTLLSSMQCTPIRGFEADVAMTYADYCLFQNEFYRQQKTDRSIESLDNNSRMPGWYFRYVDTSTTLFSYDYSHVRKLHGLGINIHILRKHKFSPQSLFLQFIECGLKSGIHFSYKRFQIGRPFNPLARFVVELMRKTWTLGKTPTWLISLFENNALDNPENTAKLCLPEAPTTIIPKGFLDKTCRVTLQGSRFNATTQAIPYLNKRFQPSSINQMVDIVAQFAASLLQGDPNRIQKLVLRQHISHNRLTVRSPRTRDIDYLNIWADDIPYKQFLADARTLIDDSSFWHAREKWLRNWVFSLGWRLYLQRKRWDAMLFVADRYSMWEKYAPYRFTIEKLFDAGCYDLLWLYLEKYRTQIKKYARKNYALAPAAWLWELALFLYTKNGYGRYANQLKKIKEKDRLAVITGDDAVTFLKSHYPLEQESISVLADNVGDPLNSNDNTILFIDQRNSTGNMEALLTYCLSSPEYTNYHFAYTVFSIEEAAYIQRKTEEYSNRVRFVVQGCTEFRTAISNARIIFTTELLPISFIKGASQKVVFIPSPSFMFRDSHFPRQLLRNLVPTLSKTDLVVLPSQALNKVILSARSTACRDELSILRCDYPARKQATRIPINNHNTSIRVKAVFSLMKKENLRTWTSFEDIQEFARSAGRSFGCLSNDIQIRIPQTTYESLLEAGSPEGTTAVGSFNGLLECINEACLLITDNISDLFTALHAGLQSILITSSENTTQKLQNMDLDLFSIARTRDEAITLATKLLKREELYSIVINKRDSGTASTIISAALSLNNATTLIENDASKLRDLLVLKWEDTDAFHDFLQIANTLASTVLLIEEHKYWLLDSDIDALIETCATYLPRSYHLGSIKKFDNDRCVREWQRIFDNTFFNLAIVPEQLSDVPRQLVKNLPAHEVVTYSNLDELIEYVSTTMNS